MNSAFHRRMVAALWLPILASQLLAAPKPSALPRATPESQGVSPAALLEFVEAADTGIDAMDSIMIVRHGHVIAEGWWTPYNPDSRHELYSLSKSFASTAVGFAVSEGRFSIDDPVLKFFPEDAPANPSNNLKAMRVRDLLSMSAGHQDETASAPDKISARSFLAHPVPHKPGTHFQYNTPASFMLSAIVQKTTGQSALDYLQPRLFEPLGIEHPIWATNFQGISLGGYGMRVRTEDIARFGQLYLQKGKWNGKQLLPTAWVEAATSRQVSNGSNPASDWDQGYGYQFWRCRHGAYRGDGAFGQYCIVFPEQDAVVAITSGVKDMQAVLNLVWDKLLPAFQSRRISSNREARTRLEQKLRKLELHHPDGSTTSSLAQSVLGRTYSFGANDLKLATLRIDASGATELRITTTADGVEATIPAGLRQWRTGRMPFAKGSGEPVASSAAWADDGSLVIKTSFYETPSTRTLRLRFEGDEVALDSEMNASFGPGKFTGIRGRSR